MDALLLNLPIPIYTKRLYLRPPQPGDGVFINEALLETYDELQRFMPWAKQKPTLEDSERFVRQFQARFILRQNLVFFVFHQPTNRLVAEVGLYNIRWHIPEFEMMFWTRTSESGHGYCTEASKALVKYAFLVLKAARIEIQCDIQNSASQKIAEHLGFQYEGTLRKREKSLQGHLRDMRIYSKLELGPISDFDAHW